MNKIRHLLFAVIALASFTAQAQFSQDKPKYEYMLKVEAGYMPYVSNFGTEDTNGYYIDDLRHQVNINVINGINISQDFFFGLGLGYSYVVTPKDFTDGWHSAMAFLDFDYRPLDVEWAPMVYSKLGAHYMMSDSPHGSTLTPYAEIGVGLNWFYNYVYRNMERNYRSIYIEAGFSYSQQTTFLPVRLGWRF